MGFDLNSFVDQNTFNECCCPICLDVLCSAVVLNCGHSFCFDCLTGIIRCPVCQVDIKTVTQNYIIDAITENAVVQCPIDGCCWEGRPLEIINHTKMCKTFVHDEQDIEYAGTIDDIDISHVLSKYVPVAAILNPSVPLNETLRLNETIQTPSDSQKYLEDYYFPEHFEITSASTIRASIVPKTINQRWHVSVFRRQLPLLHLSFI